MNRRAVLSVFLALAPVVLAHAANMGTGEANFGQVMAQIQTAKTDAAAIQTLTAVTRLNVVRIGDIAQGENLAALQAAQEKYAADVAALRTVLQSNQPVASQLQAAGVDTGRVVAANAGADGVLTVFVM
jgi:hypothetical protein